MEGGAAGGGRSLARQEGGGWGPGKARRILADATGDRYPGREKVHAVARGGLSRGCRVEQQYWSERACAGVSSWQLSEDSVPRFNYGKIFNLSHRGPGVPLWGGKECSPLLLPLTPPFLWLSAGLSNFPLLTRHRLFICYHPHFPV